MFHFYHLVSYVDDEIQRLEKRRAAEEASSPIMSGDRTDQRIAIVGGSAGMGFATAQILVRDGATVAIIGRDGAKAHAKAASLAADGPGRALGFGLDAADPNNLADVIDEAVKQLGGLDGLAVTAGPIKTSGTVLGLDDADWLESFQTQLMTVVRACRAALPALIETRGAIVTTSAYSVRAQKPILPHYTAMKAAVAGVTKNIAKTYGPQGVRANCIAPGAIATEALDDAQRQAVAKYGGPPDQALDRFMQEAWGMKLALDRVGRPEEVGDLIAFLLSRKAGYLTGALINIDGGTDF